MKIAGVMSRWPPLDSNLFRTAGAVILTIFYVLGMVYAKARPGANATYPRGWWGWSDQGLYLKSVDVFARFDFASTQHRYPLGYPLLGAPFVGLMPLFPFLIVDFVCLLVSFTGFVAFSRGCGFSTFSAVMAFLLGTIGSASVRVNWIIPWTTTPVCAIVWLFLALCVRHLNAAKGEPRFQRWRRVGLIGLLAAAAPLFRPTDLLMPAIGLMLMLWWSLRDRTLRPTDPLVLMIGAAIPLAPYGLLYLHIYGMHLTQYMLSSRVVGFRFGELPLKAYWLLISPRPWFPFGSGLLERLPWMAAGFAGILLLPALAPRNGRRGMTMLGCMMLAYMALFFSYVDLLPSGLWRYDNVHYFKWLLPGFVLFGVVLLRAALSGSYRSALIALLATLVVSGIRLNPVAAAKGHPARMLQYESGPLKWKATYFGDEHVSDQLGAFENVLTMRVLPDSQGFRVISLSRPFTGDLTWQDSTGAVMPANNVPKRWAVDVGYGWPCWLPPYACQRMQPGS